MSPRDLALQKIALRCRSDLYFLAREILDYEKMQPHVHQELCDYTTSILPNPPELPHNPNFDPRKNLLLLLMPRGTFKSSIVTIAFSLQFILNEPNARILIDSETFSKSKAFLREIQDHLMNNEKYREVFRAIHGVYPFTKKSHMRLWTDSEVLLPCRNVPKKEPTISCGGVDVTKNSMHYDLIIGDDLHSEVNVTNQEQRQKVIDHFKLYFSLLDPGKPLIIIGTRWHKLDLYQYIIDFESERFNILKRSAYNPDGSLLFPEVLPESELKKIREIMGTSHFSKQYLNKPVSDENATFKSHMIVRKPKIEISGRPINWYLLIDPSYSDPRGTSVYSDFAAIVLAGMDFQRDIYVRYIVRKKLTYSEIIDEIFRIFTDRQLKEEGIKEMKIVLEVIGTKSLSYELANEQKRRNTWLPMTEIKSQAKSKEERIRGLAPFYEFGHIFHIKECPNIQELESELIDFPSGRHDDVVDCLANILDIASPPNAKNFQESNDRPSKKRLMSYKPRSAITGA